ncbi:hypothetical protein BSKO_09637 [Bryopsis sp. KO-2023]|nr:hypothetical protein BSKO_09637 [Bryopsis sp. KO-2023]
MRKPQWGKAQDWLGVKQGLGRNLVWRNLIQFQCPSPIRHRVMERDSTARAAAAALQGWVRVAAVRVPRMCWPSSWPCGAPTSSAADANSRWGTSRRRTFHGSRSIALASPPTSAAKRPREDEGPDDPAAGGEPPEHCRGVRTDCLLLKTAVDCVVLVLSRLTDIFPVV